MIAPARSIGPAAKCSRQGLAGLSSPNPSPAHPPPPPAARPRKPPAARSLRRASAAATRRRAITTATLALPPACSRSLAARGAPPPHARALGAPPRLLEKLGGARRAHPSETPHEPLGTGAELGRLRLEIH